MNPTRMSFVVHKCTASYRNSISKVLQIVRTTHSEPRTHNVLPDDFRTIVSHEGNARLDVNRESLRVTIWPLRQLLLNVEHHGWLVRIRTSEEDADARDEHVAQLLFVLGKEVTRGASVWSS